MKVLHLWGTPYEMGHAQGTALKEDVEYIFDEFPSYIDSQIEQYIGWLPKDIKKIIETDGVQAALDFTILLTSEYTPQHFKDEIRGLADALGKDYAAVYRLQMFPALIQAACSMAGAWGQATPNGNLVQLRALDWGINVPFRKKPLLTVYHPNSDNGKPFVSWTWPGFLGSITAFGTNLGMSEKVWEKHPEALSRSGIPWHFLFRDVVQYDTTLEEAISRMQNAHRTCAVFLGCGSLTENKFAVIEYEHADIAVFHPNTSFPGYAPQPPQHPLMDDLVYVDKHTQPSGDPCMASILKADYGQITPESLIQLMAKFGTGDLHSAIFDFGAQHIYLGMADQNLPYPAPNGTSVEPAYKRGFVNLDVAELHAVEKPTTVRLVQK